MSSDREEGIEKHARPMGSVWAWIVFGISSLLFMGFVAYVALSTFGKNESCARTEFTLPEKLQFGGRVTATMVTHDTLYCVHEKSKPGECFAFVIVPSTYSTTHDLGEAMIGTVSNSVESVMHAVTSTVVDVSP